MVKGVDWKEGLMDWGCDGIRFWDGIGFWGGIGFWDGVLDDFEGKVCTSFLQGLYKFGFLLQVSCK